MQIIQQEAHSLLAQGIPILSNQPGHRKTMYAYMDGCHMRNTSFIAVSNCCCCNVHARGCNSAHPGPGGSKFVGEG